MLKDIFADCFQNDQWKSSAHDDFKTSRKNISRASIAWTNCQSLIVFFLPNSCKQSRLQKVEIRKLQLAGTGERLMISNSYNRHNARYRCSPVPARKNLLFAGDSKQVKKFFRIEGFNCFGMFNLSSLPDIVLYPAYHPRPLFLMDAMLMKWLLIVIP